MTRSAWHLLLGRIDDRYRGRPEALEAATNRWVWLGLAVFAAWLLGLFGVAASIFGLGLLLTWGLPDGLVVGLVVILFAVVLAVYGITQASLFVPVEAGTLEGSVLEPEAAPELRGLLADLRRDLGCRPFDEVRISLDFNASVIEQGRLRIWGRSRTILEIGLPLLLILTPAEFKAVMAHEFIHLSARHGRGSARIQRLHRRWAALFNRLQKPGAGSTRRAVRWTASRFVDWYWPRLQARSLALSRHHEHHADRVAASVAGADSLVQALWKLRCRGPWLAERFWPDLHRGAIEAPDPPPDVMNRLLAALGTPPAPLDAARWVENGLNRRTVLDETHPSFYDRALALGVPAEAILGFRFEVDGNSDSASTLLGADLDRILRDQSERWRLAERASWRDRHRRAALEARRRNSAATNPPFATRVEATAPLAPSSLPAVAQLWLAAREVAVLGGLASAAPQLAAILQESPHHPGASVLLGQHLLSDGDAEEGQRLLWAVAEASNEQWTPGACQILENHYRSTGQADLQRRSRDRLDRHEADVTQAQVERTQIGPADQFQVHGLDPEAIEALRDQLGKAKSGCVGAWLARKAVRYFPDHPVFVLAVRSSTRWGLADSERDAALVRELVPRVQLPGQVLVVTRSGGFRKVARVVEATPGSQIMPP